MLASIDHKLCVMFRIKLGADPPKKVSPLVITRVDSVCTIRSPIHRYYHQKR